MKALAPQIWPLLSSIVLSLAAGSANCLAAQTSAAIEVVPSSLPRLTTVDERYQSYNIEMLEVTGGRFWKPYAAASAPSQDTAPDAHTPAGMSPDMYAYRPPKDLSNARLRTLAAALGPAYLRVSGTWANSTYLPQAGESITKPPAGFNGVLTREQWKGVVDFAHATQSEIVTSFATGPGTRDANGLWTPVQAKRFLDYTHSLHAHIAAAEFMNEPTFATMGGAPKGYDARQYGADFKVFHSFIRVHAPHMLIVGPGSVGESENQARSIGNGMPGFIPTPALLQAIGPNAVDIFSYHAYAAVSQRCAAMKGAHTTTAAGALSESWLSQTDDILAFYREQRDQYESGKPLWLTETADAACGGDPWASTYLDTFRYLDQLGRLAKGGVKVVMHNTLAASDYGLLDETTYEPRPNYWAALLWRRLMSTTVLDSGIPLQHGLHVYAHCLRNQPGGVALLVIQNDKDNAHDLRIPLAGQRYTLSAPTLESRQVLLNGRVLALGNDDVLPVLQPTPLLPGRATFAPATITFVAFPRANDKACR